MQQAPGVIFDLEKGPRPFLDLLARIFFISILLSKLILSQYLLTVTEVSKNGMGNVTIENSKIIEKMSIQMQN